MMHDILLRLIAIQTFMGELSDLARMEPQKAGQELLKSEKNINKTINEIYTLLSQLPINEAPSISIFQT